MGIIAHPDDIQSILAGYDARLAALEGAQQTQHELRVLDSNGVVRVEAGGSLPVNGISPAQAGVRVSDANGNPIFDSLGLTAVMKLLGSSNWSTVSRTGLIANGVIANSGIAFTLTRAATVMILSQMSGNAIGGAPGQFSTVYSSIVGWPQGGTGMLFDRLVTGYTNGFDVLVAALPAASYTAEAQLNVDAGVTQQFVNGVTYAFLLGS